MRYLQLRIKGPWAHFRKPETNNNPLTHDFITKTALIGLIGAVLGEERTKWRSQFPRLSEDLLYGVAVNTTVNKESWGFTLRSASHPNDLRNGRAPRQMELLREPDYTVTLVSCGERSTEKFTVFGRFTRNGETCYQPVLGLHPCQAEIEWLAEGDAQLTSSIYSTRGFVLPSELRQLPIGSATHVGFERIPTFQDADWWNPPQRYREVLYPSNGATLGATGEHWVLENGETWCLI